MLYYALVFLLVALVAGAFGFFGVAGIAAWIPKLLFIVFLAVFVIPSVTDRSPHSKPSVMHAEDRQFLRPCR